jgi:hypothetical protein
MSLCACGSPYCQGCPAVDTLKEEVATLTLQNSTLRKTLGSAIQYLEHSKIGHNWNEETLEVKHDISCFKCVALKVYFDTEKSERV